MHPRDRRVGLNEALFREVNSRVRELSEEAGLPNLDILCECGDGGCAEQISLTHEEYAALRADSRRFALRPGHQAPESERVIETRGRYVVVEKRPGGPTGLAHETDPAS